MTQMAPAMNGSSASSFSNLCHLRTDVAFTLVRPSSGTTWRIQQRYVNTGLDENVAARLWLNGTPTSLVLVSDRQGGYIMGVKANGLEESSTGFYLRNAFGKMESGSTAASSMETHTGLGFAGAGTPTAAGGGYVYMRNRWYDPQTGRFLSQDPIGLAGGVNLYAYAGNNPASYSDPFGLQPCPSSCLDGVSTSIALFQGMWQRAEEVVHSAVAATKSAFDAVASRISVYARGKMGVETARAEVNLDGTYALRTQPEVGSGAVEGAVGADVRISDPPPGSAEIQASYTLKAGKGAKGGWAATVTTAVGTDGSKSITRVGIEYGGGIDFTPSGTPARFGGGVGVPGSTCAGTACDR
jgi:RHS repeat-associated protein